MSEKTLFEEKAKGSSDSETTKKIQNILISGAGISGPAIAYLLAKSGFSVTVLERAEEFRKGGHIVSIADIGVDVLRLMGLLEPIRKRLSNQRGIRFVDNKNKIRASFPLKEHRLSFTSTHELVRGELATLLYELSLAHQVEYIFGDVIDTIEESESSVRVTLAKDKSSVKEYDILIIAEGLYSPTRAKVFNEDVRAPLKDYDHWIGSFSYPAEDVNDHWGYWYSIPDRPPIYTRPDGHQRRRALILGVQGRKEAELVASPKVPLETRKKYLASLYEGTGWQSEKFLEALSKADDLHLQRMTQAKCPDWTKGRIVLLGDSAYCPCAITGMGTSVALVGAYVLAAGLVNNRTHFKAAFSEYEEYLKEPMEKVHQFPLGVPWVACPQSSWGIFVLQTCLKAFATIQYSKPFSAWIWIKCKLPFFKTPKLTLPDPSIFSKP